MIQSSAVSNYLQQKIDILNVIYFPSTFDMLV
jgi:hypothetical protein